MQRFNGIEHVGCEALAARVAKLPNLKLHLFGHIHCDHGSKKCGNTTFINASICSEQYKPTNQPFIFNI